MKHKVSDLSGALLDAAVAKAEGMAIRARDADGWLVDFPNGLFLLITAGDPDDRDYAVWSPSTKWRHGGPIIERERIVTAWAADQWLAAICVDVDLGGDIVTKSGRWDSSGTTYLIAAMRAYVASKFGEEVELP